MNLPLSVIGAVAPPVASGQAGAFTREQALDAGWSRRQVERRVAAGAWVRLTHRALVSSAATRTAGTDLWAIGLTWPHAVASHWTAAAFHRFPLPPGATALHAIVDRGPRSTRWITAHRLPLAPADILTIGDRAGPRATTPARTALDCLRVGDAEYARSLLAWLVTRRVLTREVLAAEVRASAGRWGTPALLQLLRGSAGHALSAAERRLHRALRRAGLTGWLANADVRVGGRVLATVDVLFARQRVIVEVDGWASHRDRAAFEHDRRRQNALVNAGYVVLRFTWRDLVEREDQVVLEIRRALALAEARWSSPQTAAYPATDGQNS